MPAPDSLAALRNPLFRRFALGRIVSVLGAQMVSLAVGFQLYERTGSAFALGAVGLVELVPVLFLALPAGHLADRFSRRDVAIFAHAVLAVSSLGLALVAALHGPVAAIYALLFCTGVGVAFRSPPVGAILPQLLPPGQFNTANAWLSSGSELGRRPFAACRFTRFRPRRGTLFSNRPPPSGSGLNTGTARRENLPKGNVIRRTARLVLDS